MAEDGNCPEGETSGQMAVKKKKKERESEREKILK